MTLPLPANWLPEQYYTAEAENDVEEVINAIGAGTLIVPKYSSAVNTASLQLTTNRNVWIYTGTGTTWTLPLIAGNTNADLLIYNRGSGALTVQRNGSNLIYYKGTVNSIIIDPGEAREFINDGTYWLALTLTEEVTLPTYDGSAASTLKTNQASGTPFTWTQTVGASAYGLIVVVGLYDAFSGVMSDACTVTASLGGVSLSSKGTISYSSALTGSDAWAKVFGANNIPTGSQTASVTCTQAGKHFYGWGLSHTFSNVSAADSWDTHSAGNDTRTFAINSPLGGILWIADLGDDYPRNDSNSWCNLTPRQHVVEASGIHASILDGVTSNGVKATFLESYGSGNSPWVEGALKINM